MPDAAEPNPVLSFDLVKIEENARALRASIPERIACFGVTKGCGGAAEVAAAMLAGGVDGLADSRLPHLRVLRATFPRVPLMALRQPTRAEIPEIVGLDALIIITDLEAAQALSSAASEAQREQAVVLMVEVGEKREGIMPLHLLDYAKSVSSLPGLDVAGLAINTGCRGGIDPDSKMMTVVDELVDLLETNGFHPLVVSAGNSSCWRLMKAGLLARTANHLRIGEALLLGHETIDDEPLAGFHTDAVRVRAEVLEAAHKLDTQKIRLTLAVGCQDIGAGQLTPVEPSLKVHRVTSDHIVIEAPRGYQARGGDIVEFTPSYLAMQAMAASPYVTKAFIGYNSKRFSERAPVFGKNI